MDSPFFTNRRWYQQPDPAHRPFHPSVRSVPVYHVDPDPAAQRPVQRAAERASDAKVVRIPVRFLGSGQLDRAVSAVKIQKVFRGFLVRKSLRKIKDIKLAVDEIEERLKRGDVVDLIKRDAKERLMVNESVMALLLKLDSICGVDFGVRGCRKAVIRKAIALQERIDAIVAANLDGELVDLESDGEENAVHPENWKDSCENGGNLDDGGNFGGERGMEVEGGDDEVGIVDVGVDCDVKVSENVGCVKEEGDDADDRRTERELLEKMMKENEKMMGMMSKLFERSEMQTRMLNGIVHRVEMLEKAFVCDNRLRKKKKKMKAKPAACREN